MQLDFIVIGAEKSGTTLLVELLRRSPLLAIPAHEVRYFRDPFYPLRELPEGYFGLQDRDRRKGIKHPAYLGCAEVPSRISRHSPGARLIAILRDPVSRLLASYLHYVRHGQVPCLHPDIGIPALFADLAASPKYHDIVAFGCYARFLRLYLRLFAREQVLVLEYEDFVRSPAGLGALFGFLGVPEPAGVWPLPRVNAGEYDWGRCRQAWQASRDRLIYDDANNIVGSRGDVAAPAAAGPLPSEPCELSPAVRRLVARHYAGECAALRRSGLLQPRHWSGGE